jgi:hypothetical protein
MNQKILDSLISVSINSFADILNRTVRPVLRLGSFSAGNRVSRRSQSWILAKVLAR